MIRNLLFFAVLAIVSCNSNNESRVISKADGTSTKTIVRPQYEFQYGSIWSIDSSEEGFDLDSRFSLKTPDGNANCMFFFFNTALDEKEIMDGQVDAQLKENVKDGNVTYYDQWGTLKGHGATISGKFLGVVNGKVDIFCHATDSSLFLVVDQYPDRIEKSVLPELQKIKSTFRLKN